MGVCVFFKAGSQSDRFQMSAEFSAHVCGEREIVPQAFGAGPYVVNIQRSLNHIHQDRKRFSV